MSVFNKRKQFDMQFRTRAEAFNSMLAYLIEDESVEPLEAAKQADEFANLFAKNMGIPDKVEPEQEGVLNEYQFEFTIDKNLPMISLPKDLRWINDEIPTLEKYTKYIFKIVNGIASFKKLSSLVAQIYLSGGISFAGLVYVKLNDTQLIDKGNNQLAFESIAYNIGDKISIHGSIMDLVELTVYKKTGVNEEISAQNEEKTLTITEPITSIIINIILQD